MLTVAFQGELGAYSEEAVRCFFPEPVDPKPSRSFTDVAGAVLNQRADFGLLPIENSLAGSVTGSYDVLADPDLAVVGEVITPIHHCLLAPTGVRIDDVSQVLSHPVALAQCGRYFQSRPDLEAVAFYDTAGAAKEVAARAPGRFAAIAGRRAAERYGLEVLATDVEDRSDNQTRFLVVTRADRAAAVDSLSTSSVDVRRKTALLVETPNAPGALVRVLLPFAERALNLTKIESRPGAAPWTYRFFIEVETDPAAAGIPEVLTAARREASYFRILGAYDKWEVTADAEAVRVPADHSS